MLAALTLTILNHSPLTISLLEEVIPTCRQMSLGVTIDVPENVADRLSFLLTIFGRGGFVNMCQTLLRERNGRGHSQMLSLETWSWLSTKMPLVVNGISGEFLKHSYGVTAKFEFRSLNKTRDSEAPVVKLCLPEEAMIDLVYVLQVWQYSLQHSSSWTSLSNLLPEVTSK